MKKQQNGKKPEKYQKNIKKINYTNIYFFKWMMFISICLILGGTLSFALILLSSSLIDSSQNLNPIWIVGMIPLMSLTAIPITMLVYKQIRKNLEVLVEGMEKVANGDLDTYIPTANAKDFSQVYSDFNKMVAEIQSVETLRAGMLDSLSHEIKTPISSINGFAKLLYDKDLSEEKRKKYLKIIIDESDRLAGLLKDILFLSKLDAQEIISNKSEYNLTEQIQDCVISLENDWSVKNIDLSADLIDANFYGDKDLMKSLWLNLLSNAIKFTPKDGKINIKMVKEDTKIITSISDNGIGMSEKVLPHIFERHFQADKAVLGSGQGLGLSIVKRIVRLCGGTVTADSKEGEGSTFTVTLPEQSV